MQNVLIREIIKDELLQIHAYDRSDAGRCLQIL